MTVATIPPCSSLTIECLQCVIPTLASEACGAYIGSDLMLRLPPGRYSRPKDREVRATRKGINGPAEAVSVWPPPSGGLRSPRAWWHRPPQAHLAW